ncbi:hypothetical protein [Amycolatopsis sp. cmx-4-54]|uniref:hypothetical protein n=1 Tax=Amycolatopsis sp. cmx-4-54 TaxID=2790936 RepID=UPI003979AF78
MSLVGPSADRHDLTGKPVVEPCRARQRSRILGKLVQFGAGRTYKASSGFAEGHDVLPDRSMWPSVKELSMKPDETSGARPARRGAREPVPSEVLAASGDAKRRRLELHDLFSKVLPDGGLPPGELVSGQGETLPLVQHDHELLVALREEEFSGFVWSELSHRLAGYGLGVIGAWIVSGEIYQRATEKGRPVKPPSPPLTRDERVAIASDAVTMGIELFLKKGLVGKDWDPLRGARLSTYFIGACVLCFANQCRRQLAQRALSDQDVFIPDFAWDAAAPSAERVALARLGLGTILAPKTKAKNKTTAQYPTDVVNLVVSYSVLGYASSEISDLISSETTRYSASAVRKMLSSYRKQAKEQIEGGRV